MDAVLHEPHSVFAPIVFNAASVSLFELALQKCDGFFIRSFPHIKRCNTADAADLIATSIERLVNDSLRNFLGRE